MKRSFMVELRIVCSVDSEKTCRIPCLEYYFMNLDAGIAPSIGWRACGVTITEEGGTSPLFVSDLAALKLPMLLE